MIGRGGRTIAARVGPWLRRIAPALVLALAFESVAFADSHPPPITAFNVTSTDPVGRFDGVDYVRIRGQLIGWVGPGEGVEGFDALPKDADGGYRYAVEFEVIAPAKGQTPVDVVFVEAENRGNPIFLGALNHFGAGGPPSRANYPAGLGDGFLFRHHIAYARVQWQTGVAGDIPARAQGVGEAAMRDFGQLLALQGRADSVPGFRTRLIGAISQSSWFINAFVAEGFNVDQVVAGGNEGGPVFQGAIVIDGTGNWAPINQLGAKAGFPEYPYPNEASRPLSPRQLLTRPKSDPFYVDVANYTDFYRLRASVSEESGFQADMRRYDWPSPHAAGSAGSAARLAACNGGVPVALDPISYGPYARALVLELAAKAGARGVEAPPLPPSRLFALADPPNDPVHFNALPGVAVKVPARDAAGQPIGGVRFPEDAAPVGHITVDLPHVGLDSITDACGNLAEWAPMSADDLAKAYGSEAAYLRRYEASLDKLIAAGYVLAEDKAAMLATAQALYKNPAGY